MIFSSPTRVHLTANELNNLRRAVAHNGEVVNQVKTPAELLNATLAGLRPDLQTDLLEFLDTGSSPLTRSASDKSSASPSTQKR